MNPRKRPRRQLETKPTQRFVTIALRGWKAEAKLLTVQEEYWFIEVAFKAEGANMTHTITHSEYDDYEKAFAMFEQMKRIVE